MGAFNERIQGICYNRVNKIKEKTVITWRHVLTDKNPADPGSRGRDCNKLETNWLNGPEWLGDLTRWPPNIVPEASEESEQEAKKIISVLAVAVPMENKIQEELLHKFKLLKVLRIMSWVQRFIDCQRKTDRCICMYRKSRW